MRNGFQNDARIILDVVKRGEESEAPTPEITQALLRLWSDKAVSVTALSRGNEFQLAESAAQ